MQGVERIHDKDRNQFEHGVLNQLAGIVQQLEPEKPSIPKSNIKSVGFEDAIRELMDLYRNKS